MKLGFKRLFLIAITLATYRVAMNFLGFEMVVLVMFSVLIVNQYLNWDEDTHFINNDGARHTNPKIKKPRARKVETSVKRPYGDNGVWRTEPNIKPPRK